MNRPEHSKCVNTVARVEVLIEAKRLEGESKKKI